MGERADAGAIREGADALVVEGRIFCRGGDAEGVLVRRRVGVDGRGRASIDGRMATVRELAQGVGATIDLCGQHEHQRLLQQGSHGKLLDAWGGERVAQVREDFARALKRTRAAVKELQRVREMARTATERMEEAEFVLRRIDEVKPRVGELAELEDTLPRAQHAETILRASEGARKHLVRDGGALDLMQEAVEELRAAERYDSSLAALVSSLEGALIDVEDVAGELRNYRDRVDFEPGLLDELQNRMAQLQGILRSYGPTVEDVLKRRAEAEEVLEAASGGDEIERRAKRELAVAQRELLQCADRLDEERGKLAPEFAKAITEQMARLQMGSASLEFSMERLPPKQWTSQGPCRIELLYRPGAGLTARPLRRIASGGEVSRVMLAVKVVLGEADSTETLVFDEVDAGVGGATAVALADVLAELAQTHQVLLVTHLAQVAVRGTRHFLVRKSEDSSDATPHTTINEIEGEERVAEIARMLSGDTSGASLAHAREMLAV